MTEMRTPCGKEKKRPVLKIKDLSFEIALFIVFGHLGREENAIFETR